MGKIRTRKNGITIVALAVTIVVILILAGVTINVLVGDNGLIKQSKDKTSQAYEKIAREAVKQIVAEYDIANSGETLEEFLKNKVPSRLDDVKRIDDNTLEVKKNGYTIEVESNSRDFSIIVVPYMGVYDGKAHNALTDVTVNPSDAKIEYSTDGKTFSENMPKIINASSLNVTVRVSKTGYKTTTVTKVAKIDKAEGKLTLSSTSGTYTYPNSGTFTVSGNTGALSVSSSNTNIATVSVSGNTVTVKPGTTAGKATITVTSAEASNYTAKSATYEATVKNGTISLSATPYTGTYDGKAHNTLTNVSVNPSDAKIEYSTDEKTFSTTIPTITNASSITVTVRASKAGYTTVTTKQTAKVNKATGTLTLSATSGTYTYPNSGTFTVSGNTGALSVSSSNTNIATVSVSGNTVTVKPGTTAGKATITVTSAEASNYTAKSATYEATVNNGTISLSATPYTGTYDGKAHNALTNVSVNPSDAIIEYSADGTNYSETMPTITNTSSFTVTVRASKAGYKTQSVTETVKVNKATGSLILSETSGILTDSNDLTFTVSGNTGALSVTSSDNNIATASISGNTVTIKSGTVAGQAKVTVTSAETNNYKAKSEIYTVIAPKLNIIEEDYTNINVNVIGEKIKEYSFSLDGQNWSQAQSKASYSFTGLDKVVVNESNYETTKSAEYNLYAMVKDDFDNTAVIGPIKGKTTIEVEADAKNLEYKEENGEIIITGIKRDENEVQVGPDLNSDYLNELVNKTNVILIPSFIDGKPVRKISEKFVKETTTTLSSADEQIYIYVQSGKDGKWITNGVADKNTYTCSPRLLFKNETEVHDLYILYGNAYKIVRGLTAKSPDAGIGGNYKIRNYKIILPQSINEYVEEASSKTALNRGMVKISSRATVERKLKVALKYGPYEPLDPYIPVKSFIMLENSEQSDKAQFEFLGRKNLIGIKNYSMFNKVINEAGNSEINYIN